MKKVLLLLMITSLTCGLAQAQLGVGQQMKNNNFESWTTDSWSGTGLTSGGTCDIPTDWHSINSASGSLASYGKSSGFVKKDNGNPGGGTGSYCAKMVATNVTVLFVTKLANGSISSGRFNAGSSTVDNTQNCTYTSTNTGYNMPMTAYPDSLYIWTKTSWSSGTKNAHIRVVIHNDSKASGASNNAVFQDPSPSNASNSVVNTTAADNNKKIVAQAVWDNKTNGWELQKIPFTYTSNNTTPSYILATFSTNGTAGAGSAGDALWVDDAILIYNTRLESLTINGSSIPGFDPDVLEYTYNTPICSGQWPTVVGSPKSPRATATISHDPTDDEPYTIIKVTHKNQESDENVTKYYKINYTVVTPNITLNNNGAYTVCAGENVTMTASGATNYTWSNNLGNGASKTITPTATAQYTVTGTDANGCTATAIAYVTVNPAPNFSITGTTTICSGNQATLTGSNSALNYTWSTGETTTSINVASAGTYSVVGKDPNSNCTKTQEIEVNTSEIPVITISEGSTLCTGSNIILTASSSVANTQFEWTYGNNQTAQGSEFTVTEGGDYTVKGTANGCVGTNNRHITENPTPVVTITGKNVVCGSDPITLTASSNINNTVFTWSDAAATQGSTLSVSEAGSFTVTGVVNGCSATSQAHVVTTSEKPTQPQVQNAESCGGGDVELAVSNPNTALTYKWYATENSQDVVNTGVSYPVNVSTTSKYYVSAQNAAGCQSERAEAIATVVTPPAAPTFSQTMSYCGEGDYELPATANNNELVWYSDAAGETQISANQHIASSTTFYCKAKSGNCLSTIVSVPVNIKTLPNPPQVDEIDPICSNTSVTRTLTATPNNTSSTIRWYNSANTYLGEGTTYQARNISSSTKYYATEVNDGCESEKAEINIVKNNLPQSPVVTCAPICDAGTTTFSSSASGVTIKWLTNDDELLGTGASYSTEISQSTQFKAIAVDNTTNCESTPKVFTAVVNDKFEITDTKSACEQYEWQGTTYTQSGEYTKTLQSTSGCDSVVTLNLTINNGYNVTRDTTVCDQFVWQGTTYTQSGTVSKTLKTVADCDSVVTYNLTVNKSTTSTKTITICENELPYNYEGTLIQAAGTHPIVYENAAGCDSILQLTVVINNTPAEPTLVTTNTSRCGAGQLPITLTPGSNGNQCVWYASEEATESFHTGNTYTADYSEGTTLYVTTHSSAGCESERKAVEVVINAIPDVPTATCEPRCGAGEVTFVANLSNNATTCRWYQNANITTPLFTGLEYARNIQNNTTLYVESYNEQTNCKSSRVAVLASVKQVPTAPTVSSITQCGTLEGDLANYVTYSNVSLRWYDENDELVYDNEHFEVSIEESTIFKVSAYNTDNQCESEKKSFNITINPNYPQTDIYDTTCQYSDYIEYGLNTFYSNVGNEDIVLKETSVLGCDSVVILHLFVNPVVNTEISVEECDSYTWNDKTYRNSGIQYQTFTAANGCDSLVTLDLTIIKSVTNSITAESCGSYEWNNYTYEESGDYDQIFPAANGCDSVVTLHLSIYHPQTTTIDEILCLGDVYNQNGFNFTADEVGVFTETLELKTAHNCDSIVTLNVTVNPTSTRSISDEVCAGTSYNDNGFDTTISVAGTYTLIRHDLNSYNCDSTTTLTLKVNPTYNHSFSRMICENGSYNFDGRTLTDEGTYSATFTSVSGCDSLVTLTLTIGSEYNETINASVCYGENYNNFGFNFTNVTEDIHEQRSTKAVNGCDSVTILNITVLNPLFTEVYDTVCQGLTYNKNGFNVNTTEVGTLTETLETKSKMGCDSTVTLYLTVNPVYTENKQVSTCRADEPFFYEPTNSYLNVDVVRNYDTVLNYSSINGCDSIITISVTVLPTYNMTQELTLCDNDERLPYTFGDLELSESGVHTYTFKTVNNCDSVVTLNFVVNETKDTNIEATICLGDSYTENGFNLTPTEAGVEQYTLSAQCAETGCDSVVTLTLTVNPSYNIVFNETICLGERYSENGFDTLPTESGTYNIVHEYETVNECDSILTLNLVVNPVVQITYNATACQGETFNQYGFDLELTEVGVKTLVHNDKNDFGCDSITNLNLTVYPTFAKDTTVSICDVELPFYWNDDEYYSYEEGGDYEIVFKTINQCDSIINLHLNVNPTYNRDTNVTICQGSLPYTFCEGFEFETAGEHTIGLQTVNGCDSVWNLNLVVTPNTEHSVTETICDNDLPFTYLGESFSEAGTFEISQEDDDHCITITHLTLVVNQTYEAENMVDICEEDLPLQYGNSSITESGVYDVHFESVAHCDSVITLTVNVIPTARGNVELTYCESEFPVVYGEQTFAQEGVYDVTFHRDGLCDSIVTLTLNKAPEYLFTEQQTVCEHELPYSWRGKELETAGVYYDSLKTLSSGCDSIYHIQLNVNETQIISDEAIVLCDGETETWRGKELSVAGTYYDTVNNETTGCYIIYKVDVEVNPTYIFNETATVCSDDLPYTWRGMELYVSCVKDVILQSVITGCDSIYRLTLTVNNSYHSTDNLNVCDYDIPFLWHGKSLTETGVYYDTVPTVNNCDSTFVLNLTVNASTYSVVSDTVCDTELPYPWRGYNISAAGTYYDSIPNTVGCIDIYELNLSVNESNNITIYDTICAGERYDENGFDTIANVAGTLFAQQSFTNVLGCDSTVSLLLTVRPSYKYETNASTCDNVPFAWRGGEYLTAGTYYDSLTSQYGCDSVYVLNLTINPTYDVYVTDTALRHHEYVYDEFVMTPADSGTFNYDIQYYTLENCDSIVHLTLYVAYNYGLEDVELIDFNFYPNPTSALLNIDGERMRLVEVYAMSGRLIYRSDVDNPDFAQINVATYPSGNYIVKVTLDDNKVVNAKIVIQRK